VSECLSFVRMGCMPHRRKLAAHVAGVFEDVEERRMEDIVAADTVAEDSVVVDTAEADTAEDMTAATGFEVPLHTSAVCSVVLDHY